jgi:excinuclease ABC subunit C
MKFDRVPYSLPGTIDPEKDLAELAAALGLEHPPERIEGFDISNISGTFAVASMVSFRNGWPDRANYRRFKIKSVEGQDDFASMAEVVRRRYSRLLNESKAIGSNDDEDGERIPEALNELMQQATKAAKSRRRSSFSTDASVTSSGSDANTSIPAKANPRMPGLILIDGGKGQLSAALNELTKLGLSDIPMIGLAKEFEEIYRPGEKEPLRLSHSSGALKLLQRVRDESHRFANTYNAQLRHKRISESILDDFPGIGDRRKAALLKKFGSVQRLRLATVEQIAEVPGFGSRSAAELKAFLDARN